MSYIGKGCMVENLSIVVWAIPGFLGLPSDWDVLNLSDIQKIDVNAFSCQGLWEWAREFNLFVKNYSPHIPIIMGYSMGGRLALHALCLEPELWQGAILLSTHPGLSQKKDKQLRLEKDEIWAQRFEQEEWEVLMKSWNQQEVFQQDIFLQREEKYFQRKILATHLRSFSLGRQENLQKKIKRLPMPILWMTGQKDEKFSQLARQVSQQHNLSCHYLIKEKGHRLLSQMDLTSNIKVMPSIQVSS
jgi:2-succinyl-6-hydroxy-2,4-cyclohexadiene-1-carboxylate synthase